MVPLARSLIIATALALGTPWLFAEPSEPQARGEPLSYWLNQYTERKSAEDAKEAEAAIREIGTNAIPALLAWLQYEPSQTKTDILNFLARIRSNSFGRWIPVSLTQDNARVPRGDLGFYILKSAAAEAIPELERIANDPSHKGPAARAMMALICIGPNALPAIETRLANTNFPMPPDAAISVYLRTRTSLGEQDISEELARLILTELQTNANPILVKGAQDVLKMLDLPSTYERKRKKSISEALLDLQTERQMGPNLRPGWNLPPVATRSNRIIAYTTNLATGVILPPMLRGDEPYPYPLLPGSQGWIDADPYERIESTKIPKEWRERATSWQMFRSAITHPYFSAIHQIGEDIGRSYRASRDGLVSILQEVDTSPDFGTNVLRWLIELNLDRMVSSDCADEEHPCFMEYAIVCYMAGLDSALNTLDRDGRQKLFKLAVWDADHLLSKSEAYIAGGPIGLLYVIYDKSEDFRGTFPSGFMLPRRNSTRTAPSGFYQGPSHEHLRLAVANAKEAFKLTVRPR